MDYSLPVLGRIVMNGIFGCTCIFPPLPDSPRDPALIRMQGGTCRRPRGVARSLPRTCQIPSISELVGVPGFWQKKYARAVA
jgi:hypothetical protein